MQSHVMVIILLGLLATTGCQPRIALQYDSRMEPESSPSVTKTESSPTVPVPDSSPGVTIPASSPIVTITELSPATSVPESSLSATPSPDISTVELTNDRKNIQIQKTLERVPLTATIAPVTGEVPNELLESVMKDLAQTAGVEKRRISVLRAQSLIWNDGSLGCPQPGMVYIQVTVNGYWIELEVDGVRYDYRATDTGHFLLCENGFSPVNLPVGTPDK